MTTARQVISDALTFHLNRLAPGETLDADLAAVCLSALNSVADEWSGVKSFLFREILSAGTVTGASGTLGTTWASLSPGDEILGASYNSGSQDLGLDRLTMEQYQAIANKSQAGDPMYWAHDGLSTVYLWPAPASRSVTLRTKQAVADFADLDTVYVMPKGYRSALAPCLAERLTALGGGATAIVRAASAARGRIHGQTIAPAIVDSAQQNRWDIQRGWV